jgi:small-conductance mechanosensitive channel
MILVHVTTHWFRRLLTKRMHVEESAAVAVSKGIYYFLAAIVLYYALFAVQIPLTVFTFLGGALAIGVGFGAQNLINNFISGLILLVERPIKIGDIVEVDAQGGRIVNIGARCSQLHTFNGFDVLIPNSQFLEHKVINWTHADAKIRFSVSVGVEYGSPTRDVSQMIMEAVTEHGRVLEDPVPVVLFKEFADNSLVFEAYFWVDMATGVDPRVVQSDLRHRISYLFAQAGIGIPFPQRTVHFSSDQPVAIRVLQDEPPAAEAQPEDNSDA